MEALTMTTDLQTLAAWVDGEYSDMLAAKRETYTLQANEFTAAMYYEGLQAKGVDVGMSTVHARLKKLRDADRISARQELIDGKRVWVYTKEER